MFHIAFTPNNFPANAISAQGDTLATALGELFKSLDSLNNELCTSYVACILEATKEAVDKLENGDPAKGVWSDMGCEDDAFSIDLFEVVEAEAALTSIGCNSYPAIYIRYQDRELLVPHGAVGLVTEPKHNFAKWIYDEDEIKEWDNVMLVSLPSDGPTHNGPTETGPLDPAAYMASTYERDKALMEAEPKPLTPDNCGASQLACNIVNNTFLSLDGFEAMRKQMAGTDYTAEQFGGELARIVDRELADLVNAVANAIPVIEYAEVDSAAEGLDKAHSIITNALNAARAAVATASVAPKGWSSVEA